MQQSERSIMKTSINAWSIPEKYDFADTLRLAKNAGFDGIELNLDRDTSNSKHSFFLSTPNEKILEVKKLADEIGIKIVSVSSSLHNGIWSVNGEEAVSYARSVLNAQLNIAKLLEADTILLVPGGMANGMLISEARENSIKNLKAAEAEIKASGVKVGLENVWNGFFLSPYDMTSFISELESDVFGAYLDIGNMIAFSDPEHWADIVGKYVFKIHIKGYKRSSGLNSGGQWCSLLSCGKNWKRTLKLLQEKGFDGYLTAEVASSAPDMTDEEYLKFIADEEKNIIGELK